MSSRTQFPFEVTRLAVAMLMLAMAAGAAVACGGGDSSSADEPTAAQATETEESATAEETEEATEEPSEEPTEVPSDLARWTGEVCDAALEFQESTSSFSDDINATDLNAPGAQEQVLALYAGFAASLRTYADAVGGFVVAETPGGPEVRQTWVDALALAIEQNDEIVAEVEALDAETFGPDYVELISDWGDDFSDHDIRGQINALVPEFPEVEPGVIDVVDDTEGCADAAF